MSNLLIDHATILLDHLRRLQEADAPVRFALITVRDVQITLDLDVFRRVFAGRDVTVVHRGSSDEIAIDVDGARYVTTDYHPTPPMRPTVEVVRLPPVDTQAAK